jgi:hypothetical protein
VARGVGAVSTTRVGLVLGVGVGAVKVSAVSLGTDWSIGDESTVPAGRVKDSFTSLGLGSSDSEVLELIKTKEFCTPKAGATMTAESPMAMAASQTAFLVLNLFIMRTD